MWFIPETRKLLEAGHRDVRLGPSGPQQDLSIATFIGGQSGIFTQKDAYIDEVKQESFRWRFFKVNETRLGKREVLDEHLM